MKADDLATLTADQLDEVRRHFLRPKKFFITGYSRSGKTLLARLLRLHPQVYCSWHGYFFSHAWSLVDLMARSNLELNLERKANHWTRGKGMTSPIIRVACDFVMEREAEREGKWIVGDETPNPNNEVAIQRMGRIYPDATVVVMVRDGRDAVLSRRIQLFVDAPKSLGPEDLEIREALRRRSQPFRQGRDSLFSRDWLEQAARDWAENVRNTRSVAAELYGERHLALRFEDLVSDPVTWVTLIWKFLGATPPALEQIEAIRGEVGRDRPAEWQRQKEPEIVRNLDRGGLGGWKRFFTPEDTILFESLAGKELAELGYKLEAVEA